VRRLLRVFMLSTARMDGAIGESSGWPGQTRWTDRLDDTLRGDLARELVLESGDLPAPMWLTVFEDDSSPRPGTDELYFAASKDQSSIVPPPIVITRDSRVPVPIDVFILFLLFTGGIIVIRRRHANKLRATRA